jgi:hypothetical protein
MIKVGLYLQKQAVAEIDINNKDAFGRSAYNRYYYATFICVRDMLAKFDAAWSTIPHKSCPEVLNGTVLATLKKARNHAKRANDHSLDQLYARAISSTVDLAKIMQIAYATRVVADYNLEIVVDFFSMDRFALNKVDITTAHEWPNKANAYTPTIVNAWKQAHA